MPVERYRTLEEARAALWSRRVDAAFLRRVRWLWAFADRLAPARFAPGLYRYRSIEEAAQARHAWERKRAQALRRSAAVARDADYTG